MQTKKLFLCQFIFADQQRPVVMCFESIADFDRCRQEQNPAQATIQEVDLIYYESDEATE